MYIQLNFRGKYENLYKINIFWETEKFEMSIVSWSISSFNCPVLVWYSFHIHFSFYTHQLSPEIISWPLHLQHHHRRQRLSPATQTPLLRHLLRRFPMLPLLRSPPSSSSLSVTTSRYVCINRLQNLLRSHKAGSSIQETNRNNWMSEIECCEDDPLIMLTKMV